MPTDDLTAREQRQRALEWALAALDAAGDAAPHDAAEAVRRHVAAHDASALADTLEALAPESRQALWAHLSARQRGETLVEAHGEVRRRLIEITPADQLAAAVAPLDLDALSDIDAELPPPVLEQVLAAMEPQRRQRFELLRAYPDNWAGGLMDTDPIAVRPGATLAQAVDALRRHRDTQGGLPDHLHALMVTDDEGCYRGMVHLADLLVHDAQRRVQDVMRSEPEALPADLPADDVAQRFADQNLVSAAVVDAAGRLIGRITVDDIVDVIRRQAEHSQLAHTGLDEDVDTFAPAFGASRRRALWLGLNLCNALFAAVVIGLFESTIDRVVALAVLMPVVASMGGAAGTQSLALVIRASALDQIHAGTRWRLLRRELAVGALNGVLWAAVVAAVALVWFGRPALAAAFAAAVVLNLFVGVVAGTTIPMLLTRLKIDPALAGGVMLAALTDAIGFGVFLGLGSVLLA